MSQRTITHQISHSINLHKLNSTQQNSQIILRSSNIQISPAKHPQQKQRCSSQTVNQEYQIQYNNYCFDEINIYGISYSIDYNDQQSVQLFMNFITNNKLLQKQTILSLQMIVGQKAFAHNINISYILQEIRAQYQKEVLNKFFN